MDWMGVAGQANLATVIISAGCSLLAALIAAGAARAGLKKAYLLEDQTETVLREMLRHPDYKMRSFAQLQHHVPLSDDKLREALLRAGAVSFKAADGTVLWGLLENHRDRVFPKGGRKS
jgi:hypothetical protein